MNNRILITTILPEPLIAKYHLSSAACYFSSNLLSGGGFNAAYSIMPLFIGGQLEKEAFNDPRFELVYDKFRNIRGIWRNIAVIKEQWFIFTKIRKESSVWFYNINILNAILYILLAVFKRSVKLNVIVLDFTPIERCVSLNRLYLKLINSAHGRICLANSPLFNRENTVIIPGVVPDNNLEIPCLENPTPKFLLSGSLSEAIAQTTMVLEAFSKLPECELHISGGQDVKIVEDYANMYPNIVCHKQMMYVDYLDLLHSITFQLSTRDANYPENQCNFPSKIIEALLHNRAVISTIHYPQLNGINYFEVPSNLDAFIYEIKRISSLSHDEVMPYVNQMDVVKSLFSTEVWNDAMKKIEN